jgi:MFS family permease
MTPLSALLLRVFAPFAAGYFLSFLYRAVNAVLAPELLRDLAIGPSSLGLLTAAYFIAFASFQLPLGVLLDRFGPRRVEALLLLVAALGAFCFARADSMAELILGRALIGLGVSACLMAAFKAYTQWFAAEQWPLINGFQMAAGGLGALAATSPVQWLLQWTDWRGVFVGLGLCTLAVSALVLLVVPERGAAAKGETFADQARGVAIVFTDHGFWRIAPLTALSQASLFAVQGLWAGPWLKNVNHLDPPAVVQMLFWIALAMVSGFIGLGALAKHLQQRGVPVLVSAVAGMVLFMAAQLLLLVAPTRWATPIWLGFGFFGTSGIIAYAALSQSFPARLAGRVTTAINLLVFVAAFAGQWAIGVIVGWQPDAGPGQLPASGLQTGFAVLLLCQICALIWFVSAGRRNRSIDPVHQELPPNDGPAGAVSPK